MALRQILPTQSLCRCCRKYQIRSFIASLGASTYPPLQPLHHPIRSISQTSSARQAQQEKDRTESVFPNIHEEVREIREELKDVRSQISEQDEDVSVPWYLQVPQTFQQPENPVAARQRIPDLPENPPPILAPLLERISVDLGMDDLSLLDLRILDPPPALGADLIMIVGTARSEKHLHISADRLCRWLRTEYKMRPYADGLLGRNELKLKMRRKAKRSRLLSAVGAKQDSEGEFDDGIRTGWVCVNLGRVPGGELPKSEEKIQAAEGIIGFGARSEGSSVVVQLMTEEKRGEINLETLWTGILNRAKREQARPSENDSEASIDPGDPGESPDIQNMSQSAQQNQPHTSMYSHGASG